MAQGDSINTASRMESNAFPMTIHVSEAFYQDVKDASKFAPCGPRVIKGKGDMLTYLVKVRAFVAPAGNQQLHHVEWSAYRSACLPIILDGQHMGLHDEHA